MFKNSAASAFASKKIASSKWLLLLCAASAAAVDIIIIAMLFAGGERGEYLACPFILLIFDAFYFAVSLLLTNFRFKYSVGVWVSYVVLYTVGLVIGLSIILGADGTVLTNSAIALWACVHAFNIVCAVICALFASHIIKKLWFALAFAVIFLAGAATYAGYMFTLGFFGQGTGSRTLVYSYNNSTGQYTVTDVLAGRSNTVTVPETFNGKPVVGVSFRVFANKGITTCNLPSNVAFTGENNLAHDLDLTGIRINVDRKSVNDIRQKILAFAKMSNNSLRKNALALSNATLPVNLAENEGYVAFNYDEDGFSATDGNTIPVYVGDLNRFDFAEYTADYDYVARRENGAADNYYWACNNTQGYILSEIEADGGNIFNGVTKNTVAAMKFEKVYRIKVDDGNDTKYLMREKQPDFCYDTVGGASDYKYMTETKARTYLEGLTPRKGFTNKWLYYFNTPAQNNSYFTDLSEVLKNANGRIPTISARWELDRPTVSVSTSAVNNTITYGENVTLSSEVNHQADGITVNYNWTFENELQIKWRTQNVNLTLPKPSENAGTYKLTVTVGCDEVTSLGAVAEASVHLNINRKQVTFDWHLPEDTVYDGTVKDVSVSLSDDRQVEGDPVGYTFVGLSRIINAGTYNFSIVTDVITNLNYEVLNPINSVTIQPCPVQVNWDNYEGLMYNGALQSPTASATGVNSDGALPVTVSGGTKNAGAHTATATTSNTNYAITNPTRTYIIAKKPLTITANNVIVAYGKTEPKKVTVSESQCQGFADGDGVSSLSGTAWESYEGKDFGVYEGGVKIRGLSSNNYDINYVYGQLTVGRRAIQLEWINTDNLVYDGSPKNVTAVVTNKGYEDDDIRVIVTDGNAYAAGTYTATAEIDPDCASANNYSFTYAPADNRQCTYNIQKRTATADWYVTQNGAKVSTYVYNGNPYSVIADAIGAVDFDKQLFRVEGEINPVNAGTYTYTLIADKSIADNYDIINGKFEFTIEKAQAEINTLLNGVSVSGEVFTAHVGDTLSWQSNFPDDVEGYYGFNNESGDAYGGSILHSADTFTLSVEGEYNFTVYILGTSNYSAKTVIFKVNVLPVGISYPEVV